MPDEPSAQHNQRDQRVVRLHPNHRRALAVLLAQVAEAIARYETWTNDRLEERLTFTKRPDDLTDRERQALHDTALALVRDANRLADMFNLETQDTSVRASLAGAFTVLWSDIEDSGPEHLAGYGPVSPEVGNLLDPEIKRLAHLSLRIAQLAAGQAQGSGARPRTGCSGATADDGRA